MYIMELVYGLITGIRSSSQELNETNFIDEQLSKMFQNLTLVLDKANRCTKLFLAL